MKIMAEVEIDTTEMGARIYKEMKAQGMSVLRLSKEAGLSRSTINRALGPEGDSISHGTIVGICKGLKVSANWLLCGNEDGRFQ